MNQAEIKSNLPIDLPKISVRLFFAKESRFDFIWHICDSALGVSTGADRQVKFFALHGKPIYPAVRADTVLQVDLQKGTDSICLQCLDEFTLAADLIRSKRLLKFE